MKDTGVTTMTLKKINRGKVYQYIYRQKAASKQQIVQDLKMGLSTVSQNLAALEDEGLIRKDGLFESTGGRKAHVIQIVADVKVSIGVGILKNMIHIVSVNLYGDLLQAQTVAIPYSNSCDYYEEIAMHIRRFIKSHSYADSQILGVAVATQGITSKDGTSVTYGAIMGNTDMKLSDFASHIPYPCRIEHDSKAAAVLELWNHEELDSAVVFLLNRNLGGAVIANHRILNGQSMRCGVVEHICIDPAGPVCYCGQRGCLETYCSANALEQAAGMPIREFFSQLREGEAPKLEAVWDSYLTNLAAAARNLNLIMDSPIIISGYLAPYFTQEDLDTLLTRINGATPFPIGPEQLLVGTHGQYTPAIGAALHYVKRFVQDISMNS